VNIRIIAAANQPLHQAVSKGLFREDLYHRLDLLRLRLAPLRERKEDLPDLTHFLCRSIASRYKLEPPTLSQQGRARLLSYGWPGNIRELSHEVERQLILHSGGDLSFDSLQGLIHPEQGSGSLSDGDWLCPGWMVPEDGFNLAEAEQRFIQLALQQTGGNVSRAARLLGVTRDFIRYRIDPKKK
jgi:DNA-binding NtrC family response regulator